MTKARILALAFLIRWLCGFPDAALAQQEIVTLSTRPGVTQSYFLTSIPKDLQAMAVLFPGSGGLINLRSENGQPKFGQGNFLVRSRAEFVKRGVIAAIIDAPSDQQGGWGMSDEFRLGDAHFTDISAVIDDLDKRFPERAGISDWDEPRNYFCRGAGRSARSTAGRGDLDLDDVSPSSQEIKGAGSRFEQFRFRDDQNSRPVHAPRERSMRSYAVQRRGEAIGQVSIDHGVWRCAAAVGPVRCVQRARLFRQRVRDCRTDCKLDA